VSKKANPVIDGKKECNTCNQIKDVKNFYYDKTVERYKGRCNRCNAYAVLQKNRRLGMRPRANPIIDGKKECTGCHEMLPVDNYYLNRGKTIAQCKKCKAKLHYVWINTHGEHMREYRKSQWANLSKEEREKKKIYIRQWRYNTEGGKKFSERRLKAARKRYYEIKNDPVANRLFLERARKYENERRKNNPQFRLKQNLSRRIRGALTKFKTRKNISTLKLTGIKSIQFLMHHIAKQFKPNSEGVPMAWDNYGEWHIDHIKPCSSFDLTCPIQQKLCFHYTNLQPLWAIDNLVKQDKIL
tara:strand:- start:35 stop:931 length:897 start_codon:yes stop_codon:yes gene_type:complete